ncbi:MAG TPA: ATP-binding protein, partial [Terriglobales bacterium]|nr:ATP-binding protein [Terriglobales bacterium]
ALALIQAALEVTRAEVRPTELALADIDVRELLEQLVRENQLPADRQSLRVELEVPPQLPRLRSDSIKLTMILRNLISNALKFTEAGCVQISVEQIDGSMRFVVADTGIGIGPDELPYLFEPFRQAHGSRSRRAGGSGLGLYIVNRLVDLLGGSISVDSKPGVGTSFCVALPLEPPLSEAEGSISPP